MLLDELYDECMFLQDYHLLNKDLCDEIGYTYKIKNKYHPKNDPRFSSYFKKGVGRAKERDSWFIKQIAFAIVSELSYCEFGIPSFDDLINLYDVSGYTQLEMEEYAVSGGIDMENIINEHMRPNILILTRVLAEALQEMAEGKKVGPYINNLKNTINYMIEVKAFTGINTKEAIDEYRDFVVNYALETFNEEILYYEEYHINEYIDKKESNEIKTFVEQITNELKRSNVLANNLMVTNQFQNNMISHDILSNIMDTDERYVAIDNLCKLVNMCPTNIKSYVEQAIVRKKYWGKIKANVRTAKITGVKEYKDTLHRGFSHISMHDVAIGALNDILNGDENIFPTHIGVMIWQKYISYSPRPAKTLMSFSELSDEKVWDNHIPEVLDQYGEKIYSEDDFITVPFDYVNSDRNNSITVPISSVLAHHSNHFVFSEMWIRKSYVELFKDAGCTERKSRDLAVMISTLNMVDYYETMGDSIPPNCLLRLSLERHNSMGNSSEDELRKINADLQTQNDKLTKTVYQQKKENQLDAHNIVMLERQLEEANSKIDSLKNEVFNLTCNSVKDTENEQNEVESKITYPIDTNRNIIVFGGFENFHRKLKEFITDIKTIEVSEHIDLNPIKNAEMVFYQINKSDHSSYWFVKEACNNAGVPFYHLNHASAERCADEIVKEVNKVFNVS